VLIRRDAIRRRVPIYRGVLRMADEQLRRGVVFAQPGGCEPEVVEEGRDRCLVLRAASAVQPMPIMAPRWSTASTATTSTTTFPP